MILANQYFHSLHAATKPAGPARRERGFRVFCAVVCLMASVRQSDAGLKIYYLRHAEAGHNVVKQWAEVPKAQRPGYVGNGNEFTPKGETQVVAATEKLQKYHFDFVAVSPMWRTRHSILPYLKTSGSTGEIWPELHEFSGGSLILATNLPPPAGLILNAGPPVQLPPGEAAYFRLREDAQKDFKVSPKKGEEHEAGLQFVVQHTIDLIRQRFGGTDKAILLVGHGTSGKALLRMLTNNKEAGRPGLTNAGIWMVEEQPNGQFKLMMYNDAPYEKKRAASAEPR